MAKNTLGARLVDPAVTEVKIFDEMFRKKAKIVSIDAYSGHADMRDLDQFVFSTKDIQKVILVHGELDAMEPFAKRIATAKKVSVVMPEREEEIVL